MDSRQYDEDEGRGAPVPDDAVDVTKPGMPPSDAGSGAPPPDAGDAARGPSSAVAAAADSAADSAADTAAAGVGGSAETPTSEAGAATVQPGAEASALSAVAAVSGAAAASGAAVVSDVAAVSDAAVPGTAAAPDSAAASDAADAADAADAPDAANAANAANAGTPSSGSAAASDPAVDVAALAAPLRARLAEVSSAALSALPPGDLPQPLRPIARFAPAKRARAGESALLAALGASAVFRAQVRDWAARHRPGALQMPADDPVGAAAAAILTAHPAAPHLAELVALRATDSAHRAERDTALAKIDRLTRELDTLRAKVTGIDADADRRTDEARTEGDRLRGRLREQGTRLRVARDEADAANAALAELRAETDLEVKRIEAERDAERTRAEAERDRARAAWQAAEVARQAAKEARAADETRLALLVETIEGAVAGLRGELSIGGATGARPADTVQRAQGAFAASRVVRDVAALDTFLTMPAAHLVVDGYNVTKTGYPELSLADQRDRLARQLAALAARTGAEVTVVFDGAGVVAHASWPRGVRVLFSEPGVLADDVIRELVAAEPFGRPVVVATSDNAVVASVRADGAHSVASSVLVKRLTRV